MTSIIIPAYNAEKYLQTAIDSVLSQSDSDWELILVDDGSADATGEICDKAAKADSRIRVIHIPNSGVSAARNKGLDEARGEYIAFLDADDSLHFDFLNLLKKELLSGNVRMAAAPLTYSQNNIKKNKISSETFILPSKIAVSSLLYQVAISNSGQILDTSVCGKLYKSELWEKMRFQSGKRYEDLDILYKIILESEEICFIPVPLYYYFQNPSSFIHNISSSRTDVLDVTDNICGYLQKSLNVSAAESENLVQAARTRRFAAHCNIFLLLLNRKGYGAVRKRCLKVIREERAMVLHNRQARFKDRLGALLSYLLF